MYNFLQIAQVVQTNVYQVQLWMIHNGHHVMPLGFLGLVVLMEKMLILQTIVKLLLPKVLQITQNIIGNVLHNMMEVI